MDEQTDGAFWRGAFCAGHILLDCVDASEKLHYKPLNRGGLLAARMFCAPGA
jgi:hypothetical protein